jgi:hypothetical protein
MIQLIFLKEDFVKSSFGLPNKYIEENLSYLYKFD